MAIYVPGRVLFLSRYPGGLISLAIAQIVSIGPTHVYRSGGSGGGIETLECTATMVTGAEITLTGSQDEVLAAIADAATYVAPSTAEIVDALAAQVTADTGSLGVALHQVGG